MSEHPQCQGCGRSDYRLENDDCAYSIPLQVGVNTCVELVEIVELLLKKTRWNPAVVPPPGGGVELAQVVGNGTTVARPKEVASARYF